MRRSTIKPMAKNRKQTRRTRSNGQYNPNGNAKRHRCGTCGRMRKSSFMKPLRVVTLNNRDQEWKCVNCKDRVVFKKD